MGQFYVAVYKVRVQDKLGPIKTGQPHHFLRPLRPSSSCGLSAGSVVMGPLLPQRVVFADPCLGRTFTGYAVMVDRRVTEADSQLVPLSVIATEETGVGVDRRWPSPPNPLSSARERGSALTRHSHRTPMQGGLHLPLLVKRALDTIGRLPSPAHGRAGWAVGAERRETNPHGVGVRVVPPPHSVVYNTNHGSGV